MKLKDKYFSASNTLVLVYIYTAIFEYKVAKTLISYFCQVPNDQ